MHGCDYGHQGKDVARDVQNVLMNCDGVTSEGSKQTIYIIILDLETKEDHGIVGKTACSWIQRHSCAFQRSFPDLLFSWGVNFSVDFILFRYLCKRVATNPLKKGGIYWTKWSAL